MTRRSLDQWYYHVPDFPKKRRAIGFCDADMLRLDLEIRAGDERSIAIHPAIPDLRQVLAFTPISRHLRAARALFVNVPTRRNGFVKAPFWFDIMAYDPAVQGPLTYSKLDDDEVRELMEKVEVIKKLTILV